MEQPGDRGWLWRHEMPGAANRHAAPPLRTPQRRAVTIPDAPLGIIRKSRGDRDVDSVTGEKLRELADGLTYARSLRPEVRRDDRHAPGATRGFRTVRRELLNPARGGGGYSAPCIRKTTTAVRKRIEISARSDQSRMYRVSKATICSKSVSRFRPAT